MNSRWDEAALKPLEELIYFEVAPSLFCCFFFFLDSLICTQSHARLTTTTHTRMLPPHLLCMPLIQTMVMPIPLHLGKRALTCMPRVLDQFPGISLTKVLPPVCKDNFSIIGGELSLLNTTHQIRMYTERDDSCTLFCMTKDGVPLLNMHFWVHPYTHSTYHELTVSVQFFRSRRLVRDVVDHVIEIVRNEYPRWAYTNEVGVLEEAPELLRYRTHVLRQVDTVDNNHKQSGKTACTDGPNNN